MPAAPWASFPLAPYHGGQRSEETVSLTRLASTYLLESCPPTGIPAAVTCNKLERIQSLPPMASLTGSHSARSLEG